ncbi:hypothetical protein Vafri_3696, partial [Volvox africanus]
EDTLDARLWAEGIFGGALRGATLGRASSSGTGRVDPQDAETGQRNGAPAGSHPASEGGVLRDTQALGGAAGGLLSGITLINGLYCGGDGGDGSDSCDTLWRLALLTAALSELWAASEALVMAALLPHCRGVRTDGSYDGHIPPRERAQRSGEGGDAGVVGVGRSTKGPVVQEGELKEGMWSGEGPPPVNLCVDWALFCLSGGLDLELACRRVILVVAEAVVAEAVVAEAVVAEAVEAEAMGAEAAEAAALSRAEGLQARNPNHKGDSGEEGRLAALHSWCDSQRKEMAVRRSRLVELAAATVGGTAFHVDAAVQDWAARRTNGSTLVDDTGVTPELRHALTCRYGMLAHRGTQGAVAPSYVPSSLSSHTRQTRLAADLQDGKKGRSSSSCIFEGGGRGGEREAVLLAELWLKS